MKLNNTAVKFKIDTDADITVISENTYLAFPTRRQLMPAKSTLNSTGGKLNVKGRFLAHTVYKGQTYYFHVFVVAGNQVNNLLGCSVSLGIGLVKRIEEIKEIDNEIFTKPGLLKCEQCC